MITVRPPPMTADLPPMTAELLERTDRGTWWRCGGGSCCWSGGARPARPGSIARGSSSLAGRRAGRAARSSSSSSPFSSPDRRTRRAGPRCGGRRAPFPEPQGHGHARRVGGVHRLLGPLHHDGADHGAGAERLPDDRRARDLGGDAPEGPRAHRRRPRGGDPRGARGLSQPARLCSVRERLAAQDRCSSSAQPSAG